VFAFIKSRWVFLLLIALVIVAVFEVYRSISRNSPALQPDVNWMRYSSRSANVSFEYPKEWIVTDYQVTGPYSNHNTQSVTYNILYICPPSPQLITAEEGAANCISFFLQNEIVNPGAGFEDVGTLFSDFGKYIGHQAYAGFRIMQESHDYTEPDTDINLIGLYIGDRDDSIGMYQLLCAQGAAMDCLSTFKHVLDSVHFLKGD
jgi:hypothetical protein